MLEDEEAIGQSAATFYRNLLSCQNTPNCEPAIEELLASIPRLVTHQQNEDLTSEVILEEVKKVVFALDGQSAAGVDGFTGFFYTTCWDIIAQDLLQTVEGFFVGFQSQKVLPAP